MAKYRTGPRYGSLIMLMLVALVATACGGNGEEVDEGVGAGAADEAESATDEEDAAAEGDAEAVEASSPEYEPVTIRVGGGPFISQGALLIAEAKGYLEQVGLEMDFHEFIDGGVVVSGVVGGDLDIGAIGFGASLFNSIAGGAPLTPILTRSQEREGFDTLATVVTPELYDEGIQTYEDLVELEGRNVAVPGAGAINQYALARQLVDLGADPENVNWMTGLGQPDIVQLLGSGEAEAANLASHFAHMAVEQGVAVVIERGAVEADAQVGGIAVRSDFLEANRDAVVRFAMAYIQGAREYEEAILDPENHTDIIQIIVDGTTIEDVDFMLDLHPYWGWIPEDAAVNVESVMAQQQFWMDHFGLVETAVDAEKLLDDSVRQEALERLDAEAPFG